METAYAMYTKCMFEMYKRQEKKLYCSHTYSSNDSMQGEEKCLLHDYYQITRNSTGNSYTFCIYFCTIKKTSTKTSPSSEINYNKISGIRKKNLFQLTNDTVNNRANVQQIFFDRCSSMAAVYCLYPKKNFYKFWFLVVFFFLLFSFGRRMRRRFFALIFWKRYGMMRITLLSSSLSSKYTALRLQSATNIVT